MANWSAENVPDLGVYLADLLKAFAQLAIKYDF
jgi:hypothetical protein